MNEMYKRIEDLCIKRGVNMTVMCREAGVPRGNLTDLKMGRTAALSTKNLGKISAYFGVTLDYLLGAKQKEKPPINGDEELTEYLEELRARPECRMLFKLAKGATKADVEKAVAIIEALRKTEE